jgi:hypothetical protein
MTNFAPIEPDTATGTTAELLMQVKNSSGAVPNMTKTMANSPTLFRSWLALADAASTGKLPPAARDWPAVALADDRSHRCGAGRSAVCR